MATPALLHLESTSSLAWGVWDRIPRGFIDKCLALEPRAACRAPATLSNTHDADSTTAPRASLPDVDGPDAPTRARRLDWATLMKRAYALDVLVCPKCHGSMSLIAVIDNEEVAPRSPSRRCCAEPVWDSLPPKSTVRR